MKQPVLKWSDQRYGGSEARVGPLRVSVMWQSDGYHAQSDLGRTVVAVGGGLVDAQIQAEEWLQMEVAKLAEALQGVAEALQGVGRG